MGYRIEAAVICPTTDEKIARATIDQLYEMTKVPFWSYTPVDEQRHGFTKTVNEGLAPLLREFDILKNVTHVAIVNHDIRVKTYKWLERLIDALESDSTYGMVTPSGDCRTAPICFHKKAAPGIHVVPQLPMFCTVMKREVLHTLGYLDEEFIHYGSDSDYCEKAKRAGYQLAWTTDVFVENQLSPVIEEWKEHDQALFRRRYGWP